jgi:hypothetical protein
MQSPITSQLLSLPRLSFKEECSADKSFHAHRKMPTSSFRMRRRTDCRMILVACAQWQLDGEWFWLVLLDCANVGGCRRLGQIGEIVLAKFTVINYNTVTTSSSNSNSNSNSSHHEDQEDCVQQAPFSNHGTGVVMFPSGRLLLSLLPLQRLIPANSMHRAAD